MTQLPHQHNPALPSARRGGPDTLDARAARRPSRERAFRALVPAPMGGVVQAL
ncbi:hypothetical protein [Telmatospirillum siberiense]|uniref:hypothetical protein n=1 Tax=Telmatospirillum siberiense TaxID=382514 RepID=UPI0013043AA9|nr:hypothetical protein [Telmatospirillum siberiense]